MLGRREAVANGNAASDEGPSAQFDYRRGTSDMSSECL